MVRSKVVLRSVLLLLLLFLPVQVVAIGIGSCFITLTWRQRGRVVKALWIEWLRVRISVRAATFCPCLPI